MSDTTARDRLARVLWECEHLSRAVLADCEDIADEIISRGWRPPARTVTTVEEAEALRDGTLIVDRVGDSGYIWGGGVYYPETTIVSRAYALKHYGPFTVLYEPEEGE